MSSFWQGLTWFGDSGFLLPTAFWLFVWLASDRATRGMAVCWAILFGACGFIVMASKLAFMGWGIGSAAYDFTGFSGHTALAACVWPVACWLVTASFPTAVRLTTTAAAWVWAVLVGCSRLALEAHSDSEVVAGLLLGTLAAATFLLLQRRNRLVPRWGKRWLAAGLIAPCALLLIGRPAPTQDALQMVATWMAGIERPFTRADLWVRTSSPRVM